MIVRILGEGQFELADDQKDKLNELDNAVVASCDADDEAAFRQQFEQLLEFVASEGRQVPDDELVGSDVIVPPRDTTLAEAKNEFSGEGLIPD
ncbi:MAG: PspA-associated protein PspAA [Thermoleophilaceae bacterium]